jgi:ATP-dependent DNA helicase 2 subunit 2
MLRKLVEDCGGSFMSLTKALELQEVPTIRPIRAIASFKGALTLGDTDKYESASISIDVERYSKVMVARAISAKLITNKTQDDDAMEVDEPESAATVQHGEGPQGEITTVGRSRSYHVDDPTAPGGKRDVDKEDLNRGYTYGRTAVDVSNDDADELKLQTTPGLQIVGFVDRPKVRFPPVNDNI